MAPAVPYIALAFTVGGTAYSVSSQRKAAQRQEAAAQQSEQIGRENAATIEGETREQVRRQKLKDASDAGSAKAKAAASGLENTGTISTFLSDMTTAQKESLDWLSKSGEQRARIAQLSGEYTAGQGRAAATGTRASSVNTAVSGFGSAYNIGDSQNWW